jgi:hypothetical protein
MPKPKAASLRRLSRAGMVDDRLVKERDGVDERHGEATNDFNFLSGTGRN